MKPRDRENAKRIEAALTEFEADALRLPGIRDAAARAAFVEQLIDSIHRVRFVSVVKTRELSAVRADPNTLLFDPLKAAILQSRAGLLEDAYWLVFLSVYFGKHKTGGWRYAREVYGCLGDDRRWDWVAISANPEEFRDWLRVNEQHLRRPGGGFGNHRKYETLSADSPRGTAAAFESYVKWVAPPRTHSQLIQTALLSAGNNKKKAFDGLYHSMRSVTSFGRTARFDYLTMVGKLGFAEIEPGSAYIRNSTGPATGARLLFGGSMTSGLRAAQLDKWVVDLNAYLNVGMEVLEDALCNWQKNPDHYVRFRG
jgi:hypothetical protein